jgi:hypothetical protein
MENLMQDIEFTGQRSYDAQRKAIGFEVRLDGKPLHFFVTLAALASQFGAAHDDDPEKIFDENRLQIEMTVTLYIRRGKRDGTVLDSADF